MANKNFNTQIRKKFDNGSEKPSKPSDSSTGKGMKAKDMLDRNPNKTMDAKTKKRLRDAMERRRNLKRKNKGRQPIQPIGKPPLKKEPLRKPKDKKIERRTDKIIEPVKKPKKNTIKDKINKVGNMKVKDAATAVAKATYKGALAGTPIGAAKNIADAVNKNFKFQSPIVRKNKKFGGK